MVLNANDDVFLWYLPLKVLYPVTQNFVTRYGSCESSFESFFPGIGMFIPSFWKDFLGICSFRHESANTSWCLAGFHGAFDEVLFL